MTKETKIDKLTGLDLLRSPFPSHQIGKLPKPTKAQTDAIKADFKKGMRCNVCGTWHHPDVVHLDYVGHAALTDRLLDVDPNWIWSPYSLASDGLPAFDQSGGLWINLTVLGVTRPGYGHAAQSTFKDIGSREKEVIGDAIRNAAMRFGAALELWHKGQLHVEETDDENIPHKIEPEEEVAIVSPSDGEYHKTAMTVIADRVGTPDMLYALILDELKQSENPRDMWKASCYAPPKGCDRVGAIYLLKKTAPELYNSLRTEAGKINGTTGA
jgi:hypothetical protein